MTTSGNPSPSTDYYVKNYTLSYSMDNLTWTDVKDSSGNVLVFTGNTDKNSSVTNTLPTPVAVRFFKLHPMSFNWHISMRWDLGGFFGQYITP